MSLDAADGQVWQSPKEVKNNTEHLTLAYVQATIVSWLSKNYDKQESEGGKITMTEKETAKNVGSEPLACDPTVSRKEFLETLVRRATIAGALLAAPKVLDKFLVPPVYALNSTTHFHDTSVHTDTTPAHDRTDPFLDHTSPHAEPAGSDWG